MEGLQLARQMRVFNTSYGGVEVEPAVQSSTDGKTIPLQGINDYSGQLLKDERAEVESSGAVQVDHI